jgi:hypothetical protein
MDKTIANIIRASLSAGETLLVTFRKKDGTETNREITRNLTNIPADKHPKFVRADSPAYITAFDIRKGGWIRFHQDDALACCAHSRKVDAMFA